MPECTNCGAAVSARYCRVFSPDSGDVRACPRCPDRTRVNGKVREARASRSDASGVSPEAAENVGRGSSDA